MLDDIKRGKGLTNPINIMRTLLNVTHKFGVKVLARISNPKGAARRHKILNFNPSLIQVVLFDFHTIVNADFS